MAIAARSATPAGILVVDKPRSMTSHDVVAVVRRASGRTRVGHAGTLDPLATGVLVVCLGPATRVVEEIRRMPKSYDAVVRLGTATSTYDAEGAVTATGDASALVLDDVQAALDAFRGTIEQVPPMYSALHHGGRRLYAMARSGLEVERDPRIVTVHHLEVTAWDPPDVTLRLDVSSGTYVRSIAHDLGVALGVGAHLAALRRTAVGRFGLAEATPLPEALAALEQGWWPLLVHAVDAALTDYPAVLVDMAMLDDIRCGRAFGAPPPTDPGATVARAYDVDGHFLALVRWDAGRVAWLPDRVFLP